MGLCIFITIFAAAAQFVPVRPPASSPPPPPLPRLPRLPPPHSPSHELRAVQCTHHRVDNAPPAAQGVLVILSIEVLLVLAAPSKKDDGTKRHQWR